MKIELGGFRREGYTTINIEKADVEHDLNVFPYPVEDSSADEVLMEHVLEHLNEPFEVMKEIYRICKDGARVIIEVPYWKRDAFTNPVHKHYFKPDWFIALRPDSNKFRNLESWCPVNFRVSKIKWIRGKHAKWRKYALRVEMLVRK